MSKQEGGCLCGAVRFTVEGDPIAAGVCYCRDCQYVAGGGGAHGTLYMADAVAVTKGETNSFVVTADSGADVTRDFCPVCGVHLFSHNSTHPEFRSVKIGVFDDPSHFQSMGSIWTVSAQPWHKIDPNLPRWDKEPNF